MSTQSSSSKLQRTKLYNSGKSGGSAPKAPYDKNDPYDRGYGGLDYRDEIALAKASRDYAPELLGVIGGGFIRNLIDRDYGNQVDNLQRYVDDNLGGVLSPYGANRESPASKEDLIRQTYGTNSINADNYLNNSIANATEAEAQAMNNANASINAGQTAPEMNAVTNNMNEVAKNAIFSTKIPDMQKYGDSPETAKRAMEKLQDQFDSAENLNLVNVSDKDLQNGIWQLVNSQKKLSRNLRKEVFNNEFEIKKAQRQQQQEQLGIQLKNKLMYTNPEQFMKSKDYGILESLEKFNPQAAAPARGILDQYATAKWKNQMDLDNMRQQAAVKNELVNMYDWMNPIALKQVGKTASVGGKKTKNTVEYDEDGNVVFGEKELDKEAKKITSMQKDTDYMVAQIQQLSEKLRTTSKNASEYKTIQDQIDYLNARLKARKREIDVAQATLFAKTNPEDAKKVFLENAKIKAQQKMNMLQQANDADTAMGDAARKMFE